MSSRLKRDHNLCSHVYMYFFEEVKKLRQEYSPQSCIRSYCKARQGYLTLFTGSPSRTHVKERRQVQERHCEHSAIKCLHKNDVSIAQLRGNPKLPGQNFLSILMIES